MSEFQTESQFADVWMKVQSWQGWLRPGQAERLWEAARRVPDGGRIVEIGSFHGKSAAILALGCTESVEVCAIDPHAGDDRSPGAWTGSADEGSADNLAFSANLNSVGVGQRIKHIREFSQKAHDMVDGPINLLYVDGAHGFRPASDDLTTWGRRVELGGEMYVHDVYNSFWVTLAIIRHLGASRRWRYIGRESSMAMYRREQLGLFGALSNLSRHLFSIPVLVRSVLAKGLRAMRIEPLGRIIGHKPGQGSY